jgi:hypothetical protein
MNKLLLLLFISFSFIGTASALGAYKCTPEQAYGVTDEGVLQNDLEKYPNAFFAARTDEWIKSKQEFTIDRKTGRFAGGTIMRGRGETFTIVSQGDSDTEFKAYFAEPSSGWLLTLNIKEFKKSYKKPFIFLEMPNPIIVTGTCVNY